MAGTVTIVKDPKVIGGQVQIVVDWTSDALGDADKITPNEYTGRVESVAFIPDGTDVPSENHTVKALDKNGVDVFQGLGINRPGTIQSDINPLGMLHDTNLNITVAGAGNAKKGKIYINLKLA